jgi:hypothetical protein
VVFLIYRFVFESIESDLRGFKKIFFPLLKKGGWRCSLKGQIFRESSQDDVVAEDPLEIIRYNQPLKHAQCTIMPHTNTSGVVMD